MTVELTNTADAPGAPVRGMPPTATEFTSTPGALDADSAQSRAAVLRLGRRLGWSPAEVAAFAEALCGRPWLALGPVELAAVRDEYLSLLQAIVVKAARRAARNRGGAHVAGA